MDLMAALGKAVGDERVRPAIGADAVDGVLPSYVARPASTDQTAELVRVAADHGLSLVCRGAGTKLDWGLPPQRVDLVVDTRAMNRLVEHAAGDLVVRVEAGLAVDALQDRLAEAGQRLALDVPLAGATVGGTLATNTSGPCRLLFGTARDLLIGVTVVRADGSAARSGGKVVKNVAGYDLGKLYTGSYGTLGVITEAIFRLHPLPAARSYVCGTVDGEPDAGRLLAALLGSQLVPTAVEVDRPAPDGPIGLCVVLEGVGPGVADRAGRASQLLAGAADRTVRDEPPGWIGSYPFGAADTAVKITCPVAAVADLLAAVRRHAGETGLAPGVRGSAGGVLYARVPGDAEPPAVAAFVRALRGAVADGAVVVLRAPAAVRAAVDVWGPVPGLELMRRVKEQFDPQRRVSPGRYVGGI